AAYVPQISHLIRARCSAGISRLAFAVWLLSSLLITARAIAIGASVFIVLGGIQIGATTLIMLYASRYKDTACPIHLPRPAPATAAAGTSGSGNEPGSWRPAAARLLNQPRPPGTVEHCARTSPRAPAFLHAHPPRPGRSGRTPSFNRRTER